MASTYVNNLRLNEMATGDASGTWGTTTNTNLELVGQALGYGTEGITTNANTHTSTVADGAADEARAMYIKYTGTLDSACTITIGPNTLKRVHIIENATSGSQNIIIKQGSGATVTIGNGNVSVVTLDGAGSGAAVLNAFTDLETAGTITVAGNLIASADATVGDDLSLVSDAAVLGFGADTDVTLTHVADTGLLINSSRQLQFGDSGTYIHQSADGVLDLVADTEIEINATTIDINGTVDMSGVASVATSIRTPLIEYTDGDDAISIADGGGITAAAGITSIAATNNFGATSFNDANITNVGSIALDTITNDGTDITLDSSGDIILDADGDDIFFTAAGTNFGKITNATSDMLIRSLVQDKDIIFKGDDGGTVITALTLDMSAGGAATFTSTITADTAHFIEGSASAATTSGSANNLVLENNGNAGLTIATPADGIASIFYADPGSNAAGYVQYNHSTNLHTIFSTGDIALDADGGDVLLKDGGTHIGSFKNVSTDFIIKSEVSDKDIQLVGNDGGAEVTALKLDMSDAGTATFNHDIQMADSALLRMGAGGDLILTSDGTNGSIFANEGNLTLDTAGDIILDAAGGDFDFKVNGTEIGSIIQDGNNMQIKSSISDGDMIFRGNDGGSIISALTFDMSSAGASVFNAGMVVNEAAGGFDFRVESSSYSSMIFGDASTNNVAIGSDTATSQLKVGTRGVKNAIQLAGGPNGNATKIMMVDSKSGTFSQVQVDVQLTGAGGYFYYISYAGTGGANSQEGGGYTNGTANFSSTVTSGSGFTISTPSSNVWRAVCTTTQTHPVLCLTIAQGLAGDMDEDDVTITYS